LPTSLESTPRGEIERQFGPVFANSVGKLAVGEWSGPVESGFGMHLVRVRNQQIAQKPQLSAVRQSVENDWRSATVKQREAKAYQALLDGYNIQILKP
jgi:peptidyl-prolyl cis-trans isomerase C